MNDRKDEESKTDNAWMIRNDGKAIACVQHIYANAEDVEETLFAAEWLYSNTRHEEARRLVLETVAAWAASISDQDIISGAQAAIAQKPYRFLSQQFVIAHAEELRSIQTDMLNLPTLCKEIAAELNQEFLRARYGGMYNTIADCKEMYLRISSVGFDWGDIIRRFIGAVPPPVESITVVRDEEGTKAQGGIYCIQLAPDEFFERSMSFTISLEYATGINKRILTALSGGVSLRQLQSLPINTGRLAGKLLILAHRENQYVLRA